MNKIAIYLRVSTSDQSTDSQRTAIQTYLNTRGIVEYEIYEDQGISGSKQSRPALNHLMTEIALGSITTVITYSLSRLSRSVTHLLKILEELENANVGFISITENIDLKTPAGKLLMTILGSIGQFEREITVQRVKAGLDAARKRGQLLGRPKTRNSQLIQNLRSQGLSLRKIASAVGCSLATIQTEMKMYENHKNKIQATVTT